MGLLAARSTSLPSAAQTLEDEPMSCGIAEGAIPYQKIRLRLDALPRGVVAVGHGEVQSRVDESSGCFQDGH